MRHTDTSAAGHGHTNRTSSTASSAAASIPTALTKQCLQLHFPGRRYTAEAVELASAFLKLLVIEARRRAAIEAECEAEAQINDDEEEGGGDNNQNQESESNRSSIVEIRADHIAKIAAELLLDLS
ncbi:hypothetical protein ACHAWU_005887 [Discostella pseudostelligera]|uniref:Centromere protein X n=1 Tax=Discostella pseudostelligera TaxID=259834 RepID=A0ABD3N1Q6_9STRA